MTHPFLVPSIYAPHRTFRTLRVEIGEWVAAGRAGSPVLSAITNNHESGNFVEAKILLNWQSLATDCRCVSRYSVVILVG